MAAPSFIAAGSAVGGTGAISVAWPSGAYQADDIGILVVNTSNQDIATPSGWTLVGSIGTGSAASANSAGCFVFWKRAASGSEANASVADSGNHTLGVITVYRNCDTSASPIEGVAYGTEDVGATLYFPPISTTSGIDRRVVVVVSGGQESTYSGWSASYLSVFAEDGSGTTTAGVDGSIAVASGTKAAAGYAGSAEVTASISTKAAYVTFHLKPNTPVLSGDAPNGTSGTAYSYTHTRTGGTAPFTFTDPSSNLPPGITLNSSTGALTGTPTTLGRYDFTIRVTDSAGYTYDLADTIYIAAASGATLYPNPIASAETFGSGTVSKQMMAASASKIATWSGDGTTSRNLGAIGFERDASQQVFSLTMRRSGTNYTTWGQVMAVYNANNSTASVNVSLGSSPNFNGIAALTHANNGTLTTSSGSATYNNASSTEFVNFSLGSGSGVFQYLTFVGDGASTKTISHSLGCVPGAIIVINGGNYTDMYHRSIGASASLTFGDPSTGQLNSTGYFGGVEPTDTQFTVGLTNNTSGRTHGVILLGHNDDLNPFVYCGSYTGNGSTSGPSITEIGWEPYALIIKRVGSSIPTRSGRFHFIDLVRAGNTYSGNELVAMLAPTNDGSTPYPNDASNPEFSLDVIGGTASGFNVKTTDARFNESGGTYIYIAFRGPPAPQSLSAVGGIDTAEEFGAHLVDSGGGLQLLAPGGITSGQAIGALAVYQERFITGLTGIAPTSTVGDPPRVGRGQLVITASYGITSGQTTAPAGTFLAQMSQFMQVAGDGGTPPLRWAVNRAVNGFDTGLQMDGITFDRDTGEIYGRPRPSNPSVEIDWQVTDADGRVGYLRAISYFYSPSYQVGAAIRAMTYTGNGAGSRSITLPTTNTEDFVLIKRRDATGEWAGFERVVSFGTYVETHEYLVGSSTSITATDYWSAGSGDFQLPSGFNVNGAEYLVLTIPPQTVGSNQTATQSVFASTQSAYEGNGVNRAINPNFVPNKLFAIAGHSDGVFGTWYVDHVGPTKYVTKAGTHVTDATVWNNTAPSEVDSTINLGTSTRVNANGVLYAGLHFAGPSYIPTNAEDDIPGMPAMIGITGYQEYTGNGSSDGPSFTFDLPPKFVLIFGGSGSLPVIIDIARSPAWDASTPQKVLSTDSSAETTATYLQRTSTGLKIISSDARVNASSTSYTLWTVFDDRPLHDIYTEFGGIASAQAFGTPTLSFTATFITGAGGIASTEAFGTAALSAGPVSVAPTGIASTEAFGTAAVSSDGEARTITATGLASIEAFGAVVVGSSISATATSIASTEAVGTPALTQITTAAGIATAQALGTPALTQITTVTGIASTEAVGTPALTQITTAVGIASTEAVGTPSAVSVIRTTSIASAQALGTAAVSSASSLAPTGLASTEAVSTPTISPGPVSANPTGIASAQAIGALQVRGDTTTVLPGGLASAEAVGTPQLVIGAATLTPTGIASTEAFGAAAAAAVVTVQLAAIASNEAFGAAAVSARNTVAAPSLHAGETFGVLALLAGEVTAAPTGLASAEAVGTPFVSETESRTLYLLGVASPEAFGTPYLRFRGPFPDIAAVVATRDATPAVIAAREALATAVYIPSIDSAIAIREDDGFAVYSQSNDSATAVSEE